MYCAVARESFACFVRQGGDRLTPSNGAKLRHRLIWLYLERETDLFTRPQRMLHVAPEVCLMPRLREVPTLDYVPGDKFVAGYGEQAEVTYLDLLDIDHPDGHFDFVLCNHVLEHIPDDRRAMAEIFRVLAPGGRALITVPIDENLPRTYEDPTITTPQQRELHFGQWDHVRYYGLDIAKRLRGVGFDVEMNRYAESVTEEEYRHFGLCRNILVIAHKPGAPAEG